MAFNKSDNSAARFPASYIGIFQIKVVNAASVQKNRDESRISRTAVKTVYGMSAAVKISAKALAVV